MSYNVIITGDFGEANTGLTLNGKLFDTSGVQTGSTVTSGIVEVLDGLYLYVLSAPDDHEGVFVLYDSANTALRRTAVIAPRETENTDVKTSTRGTGTSTLTTSDIDARLAAYDAPTKTELDTAQAAIEAAIDALNNLSGSDILALSVESGHTVETVLRVLYAVIRGKSVADDADDPTTVTYYAPDNSTARVTHTLTDTERTVA